MTTRIAPGVGSNLLGQHAAERNQDATVYVGNIDPQISEELLWEFFTQAGPVVNVYVPKDKVTNHRQRFGFVEFRSEEDADYAIKVLNMIKLGEDNITVKKASQDKKSLDVGANLFIGNLDPDVDEKMLHDTFSAFGVIAANPKIMRDPDTGNSRGFGFISYDSFEASDAAIEAMTGQYLCNRQITVSYAYKKDTKGERHGTPNERLLAAANPSSRPHMLFSKGPPSHLNAPQANGLPRPFANGGMQPPLRPTPPPPPPQEHFRHPQGMQPPPPPQFYHHQQGFGGPPPPPPQVMGIHQHAWPPQHMHQGGPPPPPPQQMHHHHHMSMPPPPPQHQG